MLILQGGVHESQDLILQLYRVKIGGEKGLRRRPGRHRRCRPFVAGEAGNEHASANKPRGKAIRGGRDPQPKK